MHLITCIYCLDCLWEGDTLGLQLVQFIIQACELLNSSWYSALCDIWFPLQPFPATPHRWSVSPSAFSMLLFLLPWPLLVFPSYCSTFSWIHWHPPGHSKHILVLCYEVLDKAPHTTHFPFTFPFIKWQNWWQLSILGDGSALPVPHLIIMAF